MAQPVELDRREFLVGGTAAGLAAFLAACGPNPNSRPETPTARIQSTAPAAGMPKAPDKTAIPSAKEVLTELEKAQVAALSKIIDMFSINSPTLDRPGDLQFHIYAQPSDGIPIKAIVKGQRPDDHLTIGWTAVNAQDLTLTAGLAGLNNFEVSKVNQRQPSPTERNTYDSIVETQIKFALAYRMIVPWLTNGRVSIPMKPAHLKEGYKVPSVPLGPKSTIDRTLNITVGQGKNGAWATVKPILYESLIPNYSLMADDCNPHFQNRAENCTPVMVQMKS